MTNWKELVALFIAIILLAVVSFYLGVETERERICELTGGVYADGVCINRAAAIDLKGS